VWVWGGDVVYADSHRFGAFRYPSSEEVIRERYQAQKARDEYISIINSTQIIGVWDDHGMLITRMMHSARCVVLLLIKHPFVALNRLRYPRLDGVMECLILI
jgi:hypothetical protein